MSGSAPEGFTEFVAARGQSLHRTALLLTHDHGAAEDLLQNALVKAWRSWDKIRSEREAYVRRIIVNEFATGRRRLWRLERPSDPLPAAVTPDHGEDVTVHSMLMSALATLPPGQRAVIVLRYFHDYTEARTADELGVSVGTIKSQAAKALAALRIDGHLEDHHPGGATSTLPPVRRTSEGLPS